MLYLCGSNATHGVFFIFYAYDRAVKGRHRAIQEHGGGGRKCGYQHKRKGSRVYSRSREDRHEAGQKYSVFHAE